MFTEELRNKIDSYIEENREAVISFLEELVNLEGRHGEKEHLLRTAAFLKRNFDEIGMETVLIEVGEANAPIVTGVFNKDAAEKEIVFTGHYDTVFAAGSAGERPFHIKDGKAYGPGVCDMKAASPSHFSPSKHCRNLVSEMHRYGCSLSAMKRSTIREVQPLRRSGRIRRTS